MVFCVNVKICNWCYSIKSNDYFRVEGSHQFENLSVVSSPIAKLYKEPP